MLKTGGLKSQRSSVDQERKWEVGLDVVKGLYKLVCSACGSFVAVCLNMLVRSWSFSAFVMGFMAFLLVFNCGGVPTTKQEHCVVTLGYICVFIVHDIILDHVPGILKEAVGHEFLFP